MSKIAKLRTKGKRPSLSNRRLSDAVKVFDFLINNYDAPQLKRAAEDAGPSTATVPVKSPKIEKKLTVAQIIPAYNYKARYNDLLEKHKAIKLKFNDLKEKYGKMSNDYENIKVTAQTSTTEKDMLKEEILNAHKDLKEGNAVLQRLQIDLEITKHENEELHNKNKVLAEVIISLKQQSLDLERCNMEFDDLKRRHKSLQEEAEALRVLSDQLKKVSIEYDKLQLDYKEATESLLKYKTDNEALQNILAGMYKDQRDLRNTVQDLKGNIRVYCRIRPPLHSESSKLLFNLKVLDACSIEVEKIELANSGRKGKSQHSFTFDGIFTPQSSQEDVFAEVSSMVQSALDGYNVCIFAYGQTGSGKTYTMEGGSKKENNGIIPRSMDMIFNCMEDLKTMGWQLTIKATFLEIYNEIIYDLLDSSKEQESHDIKMVNSIGHDVYVSNLREEEVKSSHDFIALLISAQRNRQTAATLNYERTSRSHFVAQIKITAINEKRKEKFTSNLNLVDLAGSENGKTAQRIVETKYINRSLSELSKVILSLQTNQSHIPYRNSKLTHLLMPSLAGNSKTLMLVNINQLNECFSETLNSLRFATKVNSCRTTKAKKNLTMADGF